MCTTDNNYEYQISRNCNKKTLYRIPQTTKIIYCLSIASYCLLHLLNAPSTSSAWFIRLSCSSDPVLYWDNSGGFRSANNKKYTTKLYQHQTSRITRHLQQQAILLESLYTATSILYHYNSLEVVFDISISSKHNVAIKYWRHIS